MIDDQTETTASSPGPIPQPWLSAMRVAVLGVAISVLALIVGGLSVWAWAIQVGRSGDQNTWDDAKRAHDGCVAQADTRADTIVLEHSRFDREDSAIDADEATVDLIEANVMTVISFAGLPPDHPVAAGAVANIAARRERLDADRDALAAARADFDAKRPLQDPASCPPAPTGPRP